MRIEETPEQIRPYEKFKQYGHQYLSDIELLAILLRTGTKNINVLELAALLLGDSAHGLLHLYDYTYESLQSIKGIGEVKAIQIISLLELSKRLASNHYKVGEPLTSPSHIAGMFMETLRHEKNEKFMVAYLDVKCRLINYEMVSQGSLTASIVHPREVFKGAINKSAYGIIAIHNHPSGDPTPSKEDILITKRLSEAGEILGIKLLDHIVIGDRLFISLKEKGYL
ncbi:MAG: RadC family protein [Cellulosilyticaceae bacterium]